MGLPRAIKAHAAGNREEAEQHYKRALAQQVSEPVLYQNYGALLRDLGRDESAALIYQQGANLFPTHIGILANQANLLRGSSPATAVGLNLIALRQHLLQATSLEKRRGVVVTLVSQLRELQLHHWALALLQQQLRWFPGDAFLLLQLMLVIEALQGSDEISPLAAADRQALQASIEARISACPPLDQAEIHLGLAGHRLGLAEIDQALSHFERGMQLLGQTPPADPEQARKRQSLIDTNSWNFGCTLLKHQQLQRGWQLFEYGLRTPAEGKQRWQRALRKPFSATALPLWRGEPLANQRLLLLEEQAIGDVMMFLTLVPALLEETAGIGLLLGDRLLPIYRRAFADLLDRGCLQIWSHADAQEGRLTPELYQLQSPLGSICQYRFTAIQSYASCVPILQAKAKHQSQLRQAYLSHGAPAERLVGISWRGGGRGARIRQKSIEPDQFATLMQALPGVRFVSLQYGNAGPTVEAWRQQGLDVLHDARVNPLANMDLWLAQVAACDAVISVANTTIHGAGGLNIPTLCLLSLHSDWRWFDDPAVTRSYWYPSVGIAREHKRSGWQPAFDQVRRWLEQGCPAPEGPQSTTAA